MKSGLRNKSEDNNICDKLLDPELGKDVHEETTETPPCRKCGCDRDDEKENKLGENIIRRWTKNIVSFAAGMGISSSLLGYYYQIYHYIIIFGGGFVILFNTNPYHLLVLLVIISLDAFANVVVHDCPLTALERKYMNSSLAHDRREQLFGANICYTCNHVYESQVELIVNMWTMVACKIIVILAKRSITPDLLATL